MSYIDIFVLVILGLSLIFGLIGKWQKKLFALISVVVSVVIAYFITTPITGAVLNMDSGFLSFIGGQSGTTISVWLAEKLASIPALSSLSSMTTGVAKVVVFWILSLVLMALVGIIFGIICSIAFKNSKKHTAVRTLGLFSLLKGAIVAIILVFPVFVFAPLGANLGSFVNTISQVAGEGGAGGMLDGLPVQMIEDQFKNSKTVVVTDWVFKNTRPIIMTYEYNGETVYLYEALSKLPGGAESLAQVMEMFNPGEGADAKNPIETLANSNPEDIRTLFQNIDALTPDVKDMINGLVDQVLPEQMKGTKIDFGKEADTFALVAEVIDYDASAPGGIKLNPDAQLNADNVAQTLVNSNLVLLVANDAKGVLSVIPEETRDQITSKLDTLLPGEENAQQLALLKGLFEVPA